MTKGASWRRGAPFPFADRHRLPWGATNGRMVSPGYGVRDATIGRGDGVGVATIGRVVDDHMGWGPAWDRCRYATIGRGSGRMFTFGMPPAGGATGGSRDTRLPPGWWSRCIRLTVPTIMQRHIGKGGPREPHSWSGSCSPDHAARRNAANSLSARSLSLRIDHRSCTPPLRTGISRPGADATHRSARALAMALTVPFRSAGWE